MKNPFNSKTYPDRNDLELIELIKAGNKDALNTIIKNHQGYIFNLALKFYNQIAEAEDATQEVLIVKFSAG